MCLPLTSRGGSGPGGDYYGRDRAADDADSSVGADDPPSPAFVDGIDHGLWGYECESGQQAQYQSFTEGGGARAAGDHGQDGRYHQAGDEGGYVDWRGWWSARWAFSERGRVCPAEVEPGARGR